MKFKTRLTTLLFLAMVLLSIVWVLLAQVREPGEATPLLTVGPANASPGGSVEIPIQVKNLAGRNATALQFDAYFDVRWAEVLEVRAGEAAITANKQVAANRLPSESRAMTVISSADRQPGRQRAGSGNAVPGAAPSGSGLAVAVVPALRQRIIVAGMDNTPMSDGVVAYLVLRLRDAVPEDGFEIGLDRVVVSNANARALTIKQEPGWVSRGSRF